MKGLALSGEKAPVLRTWRLWLIVKSCVSINRSLIVHATVATTNLKRGFSIVVGYLPLPPAVIHGRGARGSLAFRGIDYVLVLHQEAVFEYPIEAACDCAGRSAQFGEDRIAIDVVLCENSAAFVLAGELAVERSFKVGLTQAIESVDRRAFARVAVMALAAGVVLRTPREYGGNVRI
jgi:hypothetical protein